MKSVLQRKNKLLGAFNIALDLGLTVLALRLSYEVRFHSEIFLRLFPLKYDEPAPLGDFFNLPVVLIICGIWLLVFRFNGLHEPRRWRSSLNLVLSIFSSITLGTTLLVGLAFFYRQVSYSRAVVGTFWVVDFALVLSARLAVRSAIQYLRRRGYNRRRVLVAGTGELARTVVGKITQHPGLGLEVVGFLASRPDPRGEPTVDGIPVLAAIEQATEVIRDYQVSDVYVALPLAEHVEMYRLLETIQNECVDVKVIPDLLQYITIKAGVEEFDGLPIINLSQTPLTGWNGFMKRGLDVALSLAALVLTAPLTLATAVVIKLTSSGPILFRQERMGLDGRRFTMFKFRSMRREAEADSGPVMAVRNDPRRTWVGAFIRRWSIDELPQFVNVLRGDMSLVGPRPERPPFVEEFRKKIPRYMLRHKVRSGMTGWAQVNGLRGDTSIRARIDYDIYYIENWSLTFDLKILAMTIFRLGTNAV